MTPLTRFYTRILPVYAVWPALTLTYAAAISVLIIYGRPISNHIVYIDIEAVR